MYLFVLMIDFNDYNIKETSMLGRIFRDEIENKQANRKKQIDTLKVFNDNVSEIKENAEYQVDFTAGETLMRLYVSLPPDFPADKPRIRVQPAVNHHWSTNGSDIDQAPGLLTFTVHSDLGRLVQVIIREFQMRPPGIVGIVGNVESKPQKKIKPPITTEMEESTFPGLSSMTKVDLEALNEDDEKLNDFVLSLKQCLEHSDLIDARIEDVEALTKDNLSKQEKLERLRKKVLKRIDQANKLRASFDDKSKEFEKLCQKFQPESIKDALRLAAGRSDEECEVIADNFLNREMDVEQFLVEYVERRKISQIRKTKEEKLSNQLKELQKAGY